MTADVLIAFVHHPLAHLSLLEERMGINAKCITLSYYLKHSFFINRTDSQDGFDTAVEQRVTRKAIVLIPDATELDDVRFVERVPYEFALGFNL